MKKSFACAVVLLSIFCGSQAFGQAPVWDSSGDSLLNGSYYFRQVAWVASASSGGALSDAVAIYGNISFSGTGTYTVSAQALDGGSNQPPSALNVSGTYAIGAGGFGYLSNPLAPTTVIRGLVSNGVFIGSTSETSSFNDLFIAAQNPTSTPTVSAFNGSYAMSYVNYSSTSVLDFEDAQFTLNPNGAGSLGTVSIRGYFSGNGSTVTGQQSSGVKYIASGGAMVLQFPQTTAATLVYGNEYLYLSQDGNFVFGGSPNGFDMLIGVKTSSGGAPALMSSPLYYNAGVYSDATNITNGALDLNTYYGSFSVSSGNVILHSRLDSVLNGTYSSISTNTVPTTAGATYTDNTDAYTISNGGGYRIGFGIPPYLGIDVAIAAPSFSGSGVYLNPTGVVNAASYAPFTAGLSPGELIVLTGSGLASGKLTIATSANFPTQINNVQVLIDGIPSPLYYVSPTQIAAIVPYSLPLYNSTLATIQVVNNGSKSNLISEFLNLTTPGIFTNPADGIGYAAALHANYTLITPSNPAQPGENISVYLTGLGQVVPPISDGSPGSSTNLNNTVQTIAADIGGVSAVGLYSGLAPGYAGLYQLNLTVPTGLTAGDNLLEIAGPDAFSSEALISIGSGTSTVNVERPEVQNGQGQKPSQHRQPRPSQKHVVSGAGQP